jgi:hypothetical protein
MFPQEVKIKEKDHANLVRNYEIKQYDKFIYIEIISRGYQSESQSEQ